MSDNIFYDVIKCMGEIIFKRHAGRENKVILKNLMIDKA